MEDFGSHLRRLRVQRGISAGQAALFLGITEEELTAIETSRRHATRQEVIGLASYLQEDINDFLISALQQRLRDDFSDRAQDNMQREFSELVNGKLLIKLRRPVDPLNQYVESMVYYKGHSFGGCLETIPPDGYTQLVVALESGERTVEIANNRRSLKNAWVVGPLEQSATWKVGREQTVLIVRFFPGALYAFTRTPLDLITDDFVDADALFGPAISGLREEIGECRSAREIFSLAERFLLQRLAPEEIEQAVIRHVSTHIFTPFPLLVQQSGYSHKHLIALFKKHVGITPKLFYRIRRHSAALSDMMGQKGRIDWASFARDHHYFDQAHLIKEFRHFSGYSPQKLRETGASCPKLIRTFAALNHFQSICCGVHFSRRVHISGSNFR